jgi:hypothetical protein
MQGCDSNVDRMSAIYPGSEVRPEMALRGGIRTSTHESIRACAPVMLMASIKALPLCERRGLEGPCLCRLARCPPTPCQIDKVGVMHYGLQHLGFSPSEIVNISKLDASLPSTRQNVIEIGSNKHHRLQSLVQDMMNAKSIMYYYFVKRPRGRWCAEPDKAARGGYQGIAR